MPYSHYAASKACYELYLKSFYENYGLNYRYFNVFGPKQDKNSPFVAVIPIINAILENKQPIIYGNGEQTRDFVYVKDVVKANIKAGESNFNGVVNIASGKKLQLINYLKLLRIHLKVK